jgi:CheY-like chemotaxis protein
VAERPLQGLRILLVEDFGDAREIVATILERAGAEVTPSGSSAEAMERIDRQVPDLIVADIGLLTKTGSSSSVGSAPAAGGRRRCRRSLSRPGRCRAIARAPRTRVSRPTWSSPSIP